MLQDLYQLTKPRVLMLMLITVLIGMFLTPATPQLTTVLAGATGIILLAAAGAVMNHLIDARFDQIMRRTQNRPVASGRVDNKAAALFGLSLILVGSALLLSFTNPLTWLMTLTATLGYGLVYTLWLKHITPQNIVIAGLAGAMPPLLGWAAITGQIEPYPLLMVAIIYTWTPPHFWALALAKREEYSKAEIPMMPVTHGSSYTKLQMLCYSLLMVLVTLMPFLMGYNSWVYLLASQILNARFIFLVWQLYKLDESANETVFKIKAMQSFFYSIYYLGGVFLAMLVDFHLL